MSAPEASIVSRETGGLRPSSLPPLPVALSRETEGRLARYAVLLRRWRGLLNLAGEGSWEALWRRHIGESLFLLPHLRREVLRLRCGHSQRAARLADIGSGGGLPGFVLALASPCDVHLIESHRRSCVFLREARRRLKADTVVVHEGRSEDVPPLNADIITARACAPLVRLVGLARRHLAEEGVCLFLKGRRAHEELLAARKLWHMEADIHPGDEGGGGCVVCVRRPAQHLSHHEKNHRHHQPEGRGGQDHHCR